MKDREILQEGYIAYELTPKSRVKLLNHFEPLFEKVYAHHVTHTFGIKREKADGLLQNLSEDDLVVIAEASNDRMQALVVEINGSPRRDDGSVYHITWSLDPKTGTRPVHANNLVKNKSTWDYVSPIPITTTPKFFN